MQLKRVCAATEASFSHSVTTLLKAKRGLGRALPAPKLNSAIAVAAIHIIISVKTLLPQHRVKGSAPCRKPRSCFYALRQHVHSCNMQLQHQRLVHSSSGKPQPAAFCFPAHDDSATVSLNQHLDAQGYRWR